MPRQRFAARRLPDGRSLLNLGSSARVAPGWNNVDFSWLIRFSKHPHVSRLLHRVGVLSTFRYERILRIDPHAIQWDLRRGIPFADKTFDGVYHSHVLEHIDRDAAPKFLAECFRVLKPGGILRVVVPDLEQLVQDYLRQIDNMQCSQGDIEELYRATEEIFDQMVRRVPKARIGAPWIVRIMETILVGDTERAGILHRWMYDRFSLADLISRVGFSNVRQHTPYTSDMAGWVGFHLDTDPDGTIYKPSSLYMEGVRP
jgi:SAM-dependent methyltransferase